MTSKYNTYSAKFNTLNNAPSRLSHNNNDFLGHNTKSFRATDRI